MHSVGPKNGPAARPAGAAASCSRHSRGRATYRATRRPVAKMRAFPPMSRRSPTPSPALTCTTATNAAKRAKFTRVEGGWATIRGNLAVDADHHRHVCPRRRWRRGQIPGAHAVCARRGRLLALRRDRAAATATAAASPARHANPNPPSGWSTARAPPRATRPPASTVPRAWVRRRGWGCSRRWRPPP